jgi:uncharacterized protein YjiS (DUF1127 family)
VTTLAASGSRWASATPGRLVFALLLAARQFCRWLKPRSGPRLDELPDYLLADIGLTRIQAEIAEHAASSPRERVSLRGRLDLN